MSKWYKALDNPPKEGTMIKVSLAGLELFVAHYNSQLYCAENRCPHEDIELSLGCLKDGRVICSLHGFSFDLATGKSSDADVANMQTYAVKQENNKIYIQL